ncbi:MAG: S-layer homology domain-containing protein [Limnochordia bacterium]|jgi:chromosome segregation ATPase
MKRKFVIWFVLAALALQPSIAACAQPRIADVPPDHWAYEAVVTLVDAGYLAVYEDGTFDGTKAVDRFTLATVVAQLLEEFHAEQATVTESDLQLLRRLSTEFRDDLVKIYSDQEKLEERLALLEDESAVRQEKLTQLIALHTDLDEHMTTELAKIQRDFQDLAGEIDRLQAAIRSEGSDREGLALLLDEFQMELDRIEGKLDEYVAQLQGDVAALEGKTAQDIEGLREELELGLEEKSIAIGVVEAQSRAQNEALAEKLEDLNQRLGRLQNQLATADEGLAGAESALAQMREEQAGADERLANLQAQLNDLQGALQAQGESLARVDGQLMRQLTQYEQDLADMEKALAELTQGLQGERAQRLQSEQELREKLIALNEQALLTEESLRSVTDALQGQISELQLEIGKAEGQLSDEISAQLASSMMRERRLERQLQELREDFDRYQVETEEQLQGLRNTSTFLGAAALLGMVLGLMN